MQTDKKGRSQNKLWVLSAIGIFLVTKGKTLLSLLKFSKFGAFFISMFLSVWGYMLIFPFVTSLGLVLMLLVHELGHVYAAKRKGLPVSAPLFIPFLGALISMKKHPRDAVTEAYIAMGGPLWGSIGALVVFGAAYALDSGVLYAIAKIGFFLNLINLLPIHPLDGGRISTAVTRWLWLVGLVGGLVLIIITWNWLLIIIWAMFAFDLYQKYVAGNRRAARSTVNASFQLPAQALLDQGYMLPGPEHQRDLDYVTFSDMEGNQTVQVYWEGLGFKGNIPLNQQGLVHKARLTQTKQVNKEDGLYLELVCAVEYSVYENDKYYDVPVASRWMYGLGYVGLALFLGGMLYITQLLSA